MLLGLVIHSAITYVTFDNSTVWGLKDPNSTHTIFNLLVGYIHRFRMPIFFMIAGFFSALLFHERSQKEMIKNRLNRLVYPFGLCVFLLWPLLRFLSEIITTLVIQGVTTPLTNALSVFSNLNTFIPSSTMHLWFLYYLIFYSLAAWLLGLLLQKSESLLSGIQHGYEFLMQSALLRPVLFASITFTLLYLAESTWIEQNSKLIPSWKPVCFYFIFYFFGWLLYCSKKCLDDLTRFDWLFVGTAKYSILFKKCLLDIIKRCTHP